MKNFITTLAIGFALIALSACTTDSETGTAVKDASKKVEKVSKKCAAGKCGSGKCASGNKP